MLPSQLKYIDGKSLDAVTIDVLDNPQDKEEKKMDQNKTKFHTLCNLLKHILGKVEMARVCWRFSPGKLTLLYS